MPLKNTRGNLDTGKMKAETAEGKESFMECQDSALPLCVPTCDVPSGVS